MKDYNIKTITATGHSLGGGLATLCAYDVALFLDQQWEKGFGDPNFSKWETQEKPTVRMVTFAAPRAGNAAFVDHFNSLGIEALRVVNKGDMVPLVPGGCCSACFSGSERNFRVSHRWPRSTADRRSGILPECMASDRWEASHYLLIRVCCTGASAYRFVFMLRHDCHCLTFSLHQPDVLCCHSIGICTFHALSLMCCWTLCACNLH